MTTYQAFDRSRDAANPSLIEVGRRIHFRAGYGGLDGSGVIVAVNGEPVVPEATRYGMSLRNGGCGMEVILDDGRTLHDVRQLSLSTVGIGFELLDSTVEQDAIRTLRVRAAQRVVDEQLEAVRRRHEFIRNESLRSITDPPVFYWNGIKDARGRDSTLQKASYMLSSDPKLPIGTIKVYAKDYKHFSDKVNACFLVCNGSDLMQDYFEQDCFVVIPQHPLHTHVCEAYYAAQERFERRSTRRVARA